jgi:SpoVK/Ycf46/Vps4 family AAA+-type ATPase
MERLIPGLGKYSVLDLTPESQTLAKLPAGMYGFEIDMRGGKHFEIIEVEEQKLVDLPDHTTTEVIKDIDNFLKLETYLQFKKYQYLYKRGILLYGRPGTGKTCVIKKICDTAIAKDMLVFYDLTPGLVEIAIRTARSVEGRNRKVLVIWEELDDWLRAGEGHILGLLDGLVQLDNVVYLATTNYIDKVPDRIKNRPGRFARIIEVGTPGVAARTMFLKERIHASDLEKINLKKWIKLTEGMVLDQISDIIMSVFCLKVPLEEAIARTNNKAGLAVATATKKVNPMAFLFEDNISD